MRLLNFMHNRCQRKYTPMTNWFIRRIRKKLQLNDSQQAKLITFSNTIDSSRSYVADVQKDRGITLDDIFSDNGFDRDSALHYLNVPRLAFEEQAPAVVDALGEFYQCLNQQQQEQLRAMLQKYHQHQKRRCWH